MRILKRVPEDLRRRWDIVMMLRDEVISKEDLDGFSVDLIDTVEDMLSR